MAHKKSDYNNLEMDNDHLKNEVKDLKERIKGYYIWMMSLPNFDQLKIRKFTEIFGDPMEKEH